MSSAWRRLMANTLAIKHGISLWCPQSLSLNRIPNPQPCFEPFSSRSFRRSYVVSASSFANENREFVIVGGGNAAGYAARTFVEHGMADGRLCIVSKEAYAPYERPALTKGYLFPLDKKPARLPGFHTCVGSGGERQTHEWYKENGIEMLYEDPVTGIDTEKQTLTTNSGKLLKYGSLIIATGCTASRFPEKIGGNLPGVHYIRDVADADALVSSMGKARKVVVVGGGYIGMEVAAAAVGWKLDTTIIFPEDQLLQRLFTPSLAQKYEQLYRENGVKFKKGASIKNLEAGSDGNVASVKLEDGSTIDADLVVIGIGAKPAVGPFEKAVGLNTTVGGIQVDGHECQLSSSCKPNRVISHSEVPKYFYNGDHLHKKNARWTLPLCVGLEEAKKEPEDMDRKAYKEIDISMNCCLERQGFFWPEMDGDAAEVHQGHQACQQFPTIAECCTARVITNWREPFGTFLKDRSLPSRQNGCRHYKKEGCKIFHRKWQIIQTSLHGAPTNCIAGEQVNQVLSDVYSMTHIGAAKLCQQVLTSG